ncbi:unnamed protein product [Clavelina lepadiformis]|uniref:Uncharacterized protein n=1 Tax=Clavelina lepadiformis TaxID=159417 RepID=A0ABP0F6E1_CLALP
MNLNHRVSSPSARQEVSNHSAPPSYFTPLPKIPEAQRTHDRLTSSVSTVGIEQLLKITGQKHEVQRSANMRMVSLTPTPYRGNMFASMTHQSPYATMPIMTAKEGRPDEKVSIPLVETLPLTQATPTPECLPIRKTWRMEGQVTWLHQSDRQLASPKVKNSDIHRWNEMQATTTEKPALVKIPTIYSETTKTFAQIVANTLRMNEGHPCH